MLNITKLTFQTVRTAMLISALATSAHAARLGQAVITQKVNQVTLALSPNATPLPAATGAVIKDDNIVRTGVQSRAELEFSDKTLARLGASTTFSFDVDTSTLDFKQGSVLFSKPKGTGPLQIKTAAITAAITGTTGFVSTVPAAKRKKKKGTPDEDVVMFGILEGSLKGKTTWVDDNGKSHDFRFALAPGELLVSEPGVQPTVAQFDLARFVSTSPLIKGFNSTLPNSAQIAHEVAAYNSLVSRGFIDSSHVMVATLNNQLMFVEANEPITTRFDAGVHQLTAINLQNQRPATVNQAAPPPQMNVLVAAAPPVSHTPPFENAGASGEIRGQLIWQTAADLDLHLTLPNSQGEVSYSNRNITFNNGTATATLDVDNRGSVNVQPDKRVENIVVKGAPSSGTYTFFVNSYSTPNPSDPCTLLVTGNGGRTTQKLNCNLLPGTNSASITVNRR